MQGGPRTIISKKFKYTYNFTGKEKPGDVIALEVGPIWSHNDYLQRKPEWEGMLKGWELTGHWWTTIPCSMSVIQYEMKALSAQQKEHAKPNVSTNQYALDLNYPSEPTKFDNQQKLFISKYSKIPISQADEMFICPISQAIMEEPMITSCGHTFEESYAKQWLEKNNYCPICKQQIEKNLTHNYALKGIIQNKYD